MYGKPSTEKQRFFRTLPVGEKWVSCSSFGATGNSLIFSQFQFNSKQKQSGEAKISAKQKISCTGSFDFGPIGLTSMDTGMHITLSISFDQHHLSKRGEGRGGGSGEGGKLIVKISTNELFVNALPM